MNAWIGATIKGVAALKGVDMKTLAADLDVNPSTLSNKVHGKRPWSAVEVAEVADILDVDVRQLYNGFDGQVPMPDFPQQGDRRRRRSPGETFYSCRTTRADLALVA